MQILDMGETAIDQETFEEYLAEICELYTADKASRQSYFHSMLRLTLAHQYHLLDFNCNSFTNDVIGFLTGNSIPDWIRGLSVPSTCPLFILTASL